MPLAGLLLGLAWAQVPREWGQDLPLAPWSAVALPSPDLVLRIEADGTQHLAHVPAALPDRAALTAALPPPFYGVRVRIYASQGAPAAVVVEAIEGLFDGGFVIADLAGGPSGETGYTVRHTAPQAGHTLAVRLSDAGVWFGRDPGLVLGAQVAAGAERESLLAALFDTDRQLHADSRRITLATDDTVPYGELYATLATSRARNYPVITLVVATHAAGQVFPGAVAPSTAPLVPKKVVLRDTGQFQFEGIAAPELDVREITGFVESCSNATCLVVAVPKQGAPVLIGERGRLPAAARAWILSRPVGSAPGYASGLQPPELTGTLWPLARVDEDTPPPPPPPPLGRAAMNAVVGERLPALRRCFLAGLERNPTLSGQLVLQLHIEADGAIGAANVRSAAFEDEALNACVLKHFRRMQFPEPRDGAVVMGYALRLTP